MDQLRQEKMGEMMELVNRVVVPAELERIVASITDWEHAAFEDKQFTVDKLIHCVQVKRGSLEITWKI